jgi:hypothetical protein
LGPNQLTVTAVGTGVAVARITYTVEAPAYKVVALKTRAD